MPVLEAMACGIPFVTADIPVMREVAGDVAVFVNPLDIFFDWRRPLPMIVSDTLRQEIQARGLEHIRRFSWRRCAERTLAAYRKTVTD